MKYDLLVLHPTVPVVIEDYKNLSAEEFSSFREEWQSKGFFVMGGFWTH